MPALGAKAKATRKTGKYRCHKPVPEGDHERRSDENFKAGGDFAALNSFSRASKTDAPPGFFFDGGGAQSVRAGGDNGQRTGGGAGVVAVIVTFGCCGFWHYPSSLMYLCARCANGRA